MEGAIMIKDQLKKHKSKIIIFLTAFLFYFILGLLFSYYLGVYNYWNVAFDMDTPRVFGDLTLRDFNHYRASVHPLFILFFQPIVYILNIVLRNKAIIVLLLQSIMAAITIVALSCILKKIGLKRKLNIVLSLLFGLSLGQIVYSSNIETYIFAQTFLVLLWLFAAYKMDKKLSYWDYIILVLLGIGSMAITITNFIQFLIAIFFLVFINKEEKHKFFTSVFLIVAVVSISVLLADIQQILWPSAPNFFTKAITDFLAGSSEEKLYIDYSISLKKILNIVNSNFGFSYHFASYIIPATGIYLFFQHSTAVNIISMLLFIAFIFLNASFIWKTRKEILKHKFYYAVLFVYLANFGLHLFYGNEIVFLYICHYNFTIVILLAYILNYYKKNNIKNNKIYYGFIALIIMMALRSIVSMFIKLYPIYNVIEYFSLKPVLIVLLAFILLTLFVMKKRTSKVITIVLVSIILLLSWKTINNKNDDCTNCDEFELYEKKLEVYEKQLKEMKNAFSVRTYSEIDNPIDIFYFGLADRTKLLYKDGKLIDAKTQEVLKEFEYEKQLIVPNEYTVLLKDKENNIYKIEENEQGIYLFKNGGGRETLLEGSKPIHLPEFEGYKYSEILKVLHQEILFNIDGDTPKPNIFGYKSAWYRDSMLATMVLEKTENTSLLENWVKSIDKIYDNSRHPDIDEADNLGELLYIIGAVDVDRSDLINDILKEIERLKDENKAIGGMVDGAVQKYYPTVLALYGAEKNQISLDLIPPQQDDGYARLTWYYNPIATNMEQTSSLYPYINWAFYHYSNYGSLYILDEIYPLSYEGGNIEEPGKIESECFISEYYCNRNLYISHLWHASEMFLMLMEY